VVELVGHGAAARVAVVRKTVVVVRGTAVAVVEVTGTVAAVVAAADRSVDAATTG